MNVPEQPTGTCTKCRKPGYPRALCVICGAHGTCHRKRDHAFDCSAFQEARALRKTWEEEIRKCLS